MLSLHDVLSSEGLVSHTTSLLVFIGPIVIGLFALLHCLKAPKYSSQEPPPLLHHLPYFGHAISFVKDQRGFFEWANQKAKGEPFSMLVAGDKLYIFHKSDDVSRIFRKSITLRESRTDLKGFRLNILGFMEEDAVKIAELRDNERRIHNTHLLKSGPLERTTERFLGAVDKHVDALSHLLVSSVIKNGETVAILEKDAFQYVGEMLMRTTVLAFFGQKSFGGYQHLFQDFRQFLSERFFQRLIGLPSFIACGALNARERLKGQLRSVVEKIEQFEDASDYIQARVKELRTLGLSTDGIISNEFDIIIGSNLNSIPMAYVTLLHLISDTAILDDVLQELTDTKYHSLSATTRAKLLPDGLPRLHALFREVMRYHTTSWSAREVAETTTIELKPNGDSSRLRVYELQKGGIVAVPSSLLHHSPDVHQDANVFDAKRFLSKECGGRGTPVSSSTLRPFGGGISYCPGRLFAEKQVVGYLAAVCARFDIEIVSKKWEIPRNSDFFYVTKCPAVKVKISLRKCLEYK